MAQPDGQLRLAVPGRAGDTAGADDCLASWVPVRMFIRLGTFVARHWLAVIVAWGLLVAALRWLTPAWDDVTQDGDMAYLPDQMPSVVGERLLAESFPKHRAKSQIALLICRENGEPDRRRPERGAGLVAAVREPLRGGGPGPRPKAHRTGGDAGGPRTGGGSRGTSHAGGNRLPTRGNRPGGSHPPRRIAGGALGQAD